MIVRTILLGLIVACGGSHPAADAGDDAPVPDATIDAVADGPPDAAVTCAWQVETVGSSQGPDQAVIAVAPDGRVDIVFHDPDLCGSLRHASKAAGATTWTDEVLDSQLGSLSQMYALTSDAGGDLHAAYYGGPDTNPPCIGVAAHSIYARATGGVWSRTAMTSGPRGWALGLDTAGGQAHVAYVDSPYGLGYAHGTTGGMTTQTVPTTPPDDPIGTSPSIRVDAAGVVHIATMRNTGNTANDALVYVERSTAGAWTATTVDTGQGMGNTSSIDVDAAGGVHVVYWGGSAFTLRYGYRPAGGAWTTSSIDTDHAFSHPAIKVGPGGMLHAIYAGGIPIRVHHASASIGGTWTIENVGDDTGVFGPALALGPNNELHVAYTQGQLVRHAVWACH